jgi:hypothetical protein
MMPSGKLRGSVIVAATIACCLLQVVPTVAQPLQLTPQLPPGFRDDPYVQQLVNLLNQWNVKEVRVSRDVVLQRLNERVKEVLAVRKYPYQNDAWAQATLKQAQGLPAAIEPRATVNEAGALVLVTLFIKDIDVYKKQVPSPTVREQLLVPVAIILARAQELVKDGQIGALEITRSTLGWWTAIWPFCDK